MSGQFNTVPGHHSFQTAENSQTFTDAVVGLIARTSPTINFRRLERAGTPTGAHDLLIAAQGIVLGYTVTTDNYKEFTRVPYLRCETIIQFRRRGSVRSNRDATSFIRNPTLIAVRCD